jgi:endonuclease YncB( thermonuclease family)
MSGDRVMTKSRTLAAAPAWPHARLATFLILSALVLLLSACAPRAPLFIEAAPAGQPASRVSVLHSDVLVINGQAVHLADAVTPQSAPDARCTAEALASRQTAHRLQELVQGVRTATVTPTGGRDDLDRPYVHILLDGEDPAHDLIEDGLAVAPGGKRFDWCAPISTSFPRAQHIANLSLSGT